MMVLWEFEGKSPQIGEGTWIAPSADVIGDVIIKKIVKLVQEHV